ncbi:hypothetical protein IIV31_085R [Armadillidium vulgare iridescent virus]|uniref:Uncharacterized protein n=1 Tax=Armadillidium vulgare iridescent virus TaxID=72201 RepID=A0A068QKA6_9VIRU|nr:hypothetical protein IIV31_085R [Armadillidium vulgare iridescent virus]CCV02457.1 hypothetical protein IIV31_085R [Armadillidium vulgare iridescent virus]
MSQHTMWKDFVEKLSASLGSPDEDTPFSSNEELKTIIQKFIDGGLNKFDMFKDLLNTLIENQRYAMEFLNDREFIELFDFDFPDSYIDIFQIKVDEGWSLDFEDYARSCEIASEVIDIFWSKMSLSVQQQLKHKTDCISLEGLEAEWYFDCSTGRSTGDLTQMFWTHLKFSSKVLNPYYGTEKCRCEMFSCHPCSERQGRERERKERERKENQECENQEGKEYDNESYLAYLQRNQ